MSAFVGFEVEVEDEAVVIGFEGVEVIEFEVPSLDWPLLIAAANFNLKFSLSVSAWLRVEVKVIMTFNFDFSIPFAWWSDFNMTIKATFGESAFETDRPEMSDLDWMEKVVEETVVEEGDQVKMEVEELKERVPPIFW